MIAAVIIRLRNQPFIFPSVHSERRIEPGSTTARYEGGIKKSESSYNLGKTGK
jgi:hypothetical protein